MAITETLGGLGSWDIRLRDETPDYLLEQIGFFGHIAIADGYVDVQSVGAGLLTGSRYVGVLRAKDKDTGRALSGSGMVFWLGDEDGKGDILETQVSLTAASLTTAVNAIVGPSNALTVGTVTSVAGTYTGKHQFQSRREALSIICDAFNVEFRVRGNGTVDVGPASTLYNTTAPDTIIVRKGAGTDMNLVALGGDYTVGETVVDYSTKATLLGQTIGTGDTPDVVFAVGSATAPVVPYLNLRGNTVKMVRTISESGTTTGSVAARAQLQLNRFNRVARSLKVTAEEFETEGNFVVGDNVYVYDPDTGIVNAANQVDFRGEVLHPDIVRASGITWPVVQGMTVAFRTQAGVWLDLTPFVTWEAGGNELTVGDLPKSLTNPGDNAVQLRLDAARADSSIPNPPTGLTLTTSSTLNAQGVTGAIIHASWTAPSLNTDGSVITDLSHYVVEYRWTARAPQWQQANATNLTEVDLIVVPGLPYEVRVTAYDLAGHPSAATATSAITSAADAIAPNPPADPVVTSYLGQLRIEYAGTDSTGNPMASDTNRIDVHVGTTVGFTATTATRVSSITPFAKGVAYATAPYGSTRYVRLIAVDHSGNASASSAVVSGATTQVADGDVASMSVGKLTAGTMSADVVISGRFTTALTGQRREVNAVGFQAYNASNVLTVSIDGTTNLLTGTFKTALTGRRVEVAAAGSTGKVQFFAPDGTEGYVRGFTATSGVEAVQMQIPISGADPAWNSIIANSVETISLVGKAVNVFIGGASSGSGRAFSMFYAPDRTNVSTGVATLYSATPTTHTFFVQTAGDFFVSDPAGNARVWVDGNGGGGLYHPQGANFVIGERASGGTVTNRMWVSDEEVYFQWAGQNARVTLLPEGFPGASGKVQIVNRYGFGIMMRHVSNPDGSGGRLDVIDAAETVYQPVWASAFVPSSSNLGKEDIRDYEGGALDTLAGARVKRWYRKAAQSVDGQLAGIGREELGFEAEDMPAEFVVPNADPVSELGPGLDLMGLLAATVASVQELLPRVEALERGNAA